MVRASDLELRGRGNDSRPFRCRQYGIGPTDGGYASIQQWNTHMKYTVSLPLFAVNVIWYYDSEKDGCKTGHNFVIVSWLTFCVSYPNEIQ